MMPLFLSKLYDLREDLVIRGFGLISVIAGLSKFIAIEPWAQSLPQWFFAILPIPGPLFATIVAILEATGGFFLLLRKRVAIWGLLAAVWLLKLMTLQLLAGFWTNSLRDLGLFIMAVYAFVTGLKEREAK